MALTRRRQHAIALVFLGLFVVTIAWWGFDVALNGAMAVIALGFAFGHTAYIALVQQRAAQRPVALEAGRLVQQDSEGRVVATIDLSAPFYAECVHDASEWVLYKVPQGRTAMWISIPDDDDGALVRAIGLSWPPRASSGLNYM